MVDKTTDYNKIDIQKWQDVIDAEIVDKYLINNSNSNKIRLAYYIDQKATLKKKLKAFNRERVQIEVKPKNNLVIQLNTSAFQFIVQKILPFLIQNEQLEIDTQESRNNNITLDEEFKIIERHLCQYTTNNQNYI